MELQEDGQVGGVHALVVDGAAAVQVPVLGRRRERIDRPLAALHAHHVEVAHQHQRLLGTAALQARDQARAAGRGLHDLGRDALAIQDALDVARGLDLVAGRVAGVDLDQPREVFDGFLLPAVVRNGGKRKQQA